MKKNKDEEGFSAPILIVCVVFLLLFFFVGQYFNNKIADSYSNGYSAGYDYVKFRFHLSFEEDEFPTNCSMEKFPYYLTTSELSRSPNDNNRTFWIMQMWHKEWNCTPDYDAYQNWCRCEFIG